MNSAELQKEWERVCNQVREYDSINPSQMNAFFSRLQPQAMSEDFIMDASYVTLKEAVINGVTMSCNTGENTMEAVSNKYPGWTVDNVKDDPTLTAALKQAMTWQAYALANSKLDQPQESPNRI